MLAEEIVRMEGICKEFPGVKALSNVNLTVKKGEVHALVGENGAGKSTLIKILMGVYQKDKGRIFIEGKEVNITNPIVAKELGLGAVYQDITLAPHLSVGENFFLGKLPLKNGLIDWKTVYNVTAKALEKVGMDIDPRKKLKDLSVAQQEMVAIAKMIHEKMKLVIFDEPTALLTREESQKLFEIIARLKKEGVGVIYISHRLEEIFDICDTVTVLKDGQWVDTMPVSQVNEDKLISMMVGRNIKDIYAIKHHDTSEVVLEVRGLTKEPRFRNISFELHKGEILGMFGLVGSGRTDVVRCIFGADRPDEGEIFINGIKRSINLPIDGIKAGIGFLPEDRKLQGLALKLPVLTNINLTVYNNISRFGIIDGSEEKRRARKYIDELSIKTPSVYQKVAKLSGGNQQKVVISKWLNAESNIFIFDEPTVGVDVGAKLEIYKLLEKLTSEGASIILISSYLPEIMGLAKRILVMYEGNCTGIVNKDEVTEEDVLRLASGLPAINKGSK